MTAQIVDHTTRTPHTVEPIPVGAINWSREVRARYNAQGQLWERIAEAKPNVLSGAYSLKLMDATLNAYIRSGQRARASH